MLRAGPFHRFKSCLPPRAPSPVASPGTLVSLSPLMKVCCFSQIACCNSSLTPPLPDRNTTLPHPDADLSPNATISYDDVAVDRALKRHRLSFLKKHKKTIAYGIISPEMEALHSSSSLSGMDMYSTNREPSKLVSASTSSLRLSKDGGESVRSKRYDDDTPPTSPDVSEHRRKKGLLDRLRRKS